MRIKVLQEFRDKHTGEVYKAGRMLNVKKARGEEILAALPKGYAQDVNEPGGDE